MTQKERKEIIEALESVNRVIFTKHEEDPQDMSVCHVLQELKPHVFAQGGDRDKKDGLDLNSSQSPEVKLCNELNIEVVYGVGSGGKVQSSSWLTAEDRDTRGCFCESGNKYIDCHGRP